MDEDLWKEATRKLTWAVLSTFTQADKAKVKHWARGVASGMVTRYTTVYEAPRSSGGNGHKQHPVDNVPPSTDNGRAVEGMRPVRVDGAYKVAPTLSGLPFATDRSLWVRERVAVWSARYGSAGREEMG